MLLAAEVPIKELATAIAAAIAIATLLLEAAIKEAELSITIITIVELPITTAELPTIIALAPIIAAELLFIRCYSCCLAATSYSCKL